MLRSCNGYLDINDEKHMSDKTVLVVDDETAIRDMICSALDVAGFDTLQAENAQQAHAMIIDHKPDLVLLDWMMPVTSGIELIRRLQRDDLTKNIPVIMLTAKASEDNLIQGLDVGADDYITKPFSPRALVARINAVLRRAEPELPPEPIEVDQLLFDPISHRVTISGQPVSMGPTEFRLLSFFLTHQERVYSRDQILDHVWGGNVYMDERTVDVHIRRLRKAISLAGQDRFIQTVRGAGYRFSTKVYEE
ncbi:MAG: two-component system phosphate regulon response regulator PhoB [Porticoccus sp.]|jgi:two-component system phosphate regulon response regulator PhoB|tara:strand:+ start:103828 stop:104577 length:750 start_codon:yes stop_codon:yes gene_type:complete